MPRLRSSLPALLALVLAAGATMLGPGRSLAAENSGSAASAPKEVTPPKETKATRESEAVRQRQQ